MAQKELPFPFSKRHKGDTLYNWNKNGVIFESEEHKEEIYQRYIYSSYCELCGKEYKNSLDRHLEHEHIKKPNFRNICCQKCNIQKKDVKISNNTGEQYIYKNKNKKMKDGYHYVIRIIRDGIRVVCTTRNNLEKAIICRDKFIKENPGIYS